MIPNHRILEIRRALSPMAIRILTHVFITQKPLSVDSINLADWHSAVLELIVRNVMRADYDIIHGKYVTVLQPWGRKIVALLEKEKQP